MNARARAEAKAASVYEPGAAVRGTAYVVTRLLGRGGMGAVYEVEHRLLGRKFVLKLLHAALAGKDDVVARMQNEWRTLGRLQHANIVQVTDAGTTEDGLPYYVMERLEGEVLDAILQRRRRLDPLEAVGIILDMLRGLAAAHGEHAIHRDIKPQNVFVTAAGAKLLDFGIAKLRDQALRVVTKAGVALGTPRYMAPEQAEGKPVDARTDIYATGLVLFEMLVGRGPFSHLKDAGELVLAQINQDPPRVDVLVPSIPEELGDFVQRLLAKSPDSRPRTAALAERELSALVAAIEHSPERTEVTAVGADPNERTLGAAATTAETAAEHPAPGRAASDGAVPDRAVPDRAVQDRMASLAMSPHHPSARELLVPASLAPTASLPEGVTRGPGLAHPGGETRSRRGGSSRLFLLAALSVVVGCASVWLFAPRFGLDEARAEGAGPVGSRSSQIHPELPSGRPDAILPARASGSPDVAPAAAPESEPGVLQAAVPVTAPRAAATTRVPAPADAPDPALQKVPAEPPTAEREVVVAPTPSSRAGAPDVGSTGGAVPTRAPARAQKTASASQRGPADLPQSGLW